jgi:hypothetical protein
MSHKTPYARYYNSLCRFYGFSKNNGLEISYCFFFLAVSDWESPEALPVFVLLLQRTAVIMRSIPTELSKYLTSCSSLY